MRWQRSRQLQMQAQSSALIIETRDTPLTGSTFLSPSSSSRPLLPTTQIKLLNPPSHTAPNRTRGPPLIFHGGSALWGGLKSHESVRGPVFKAKTLEKLEHCNNRGNGEYRPPYHLDGKWIAAPASSAEENFPSSEAPDPVVLC